LASFPFFPVFPVSISETNHPSDFEPSTMSRNDNNTGASNKAIIYWPVENIASLDHPIRANRSLKLGAEYLNCWLYLQPKANIIFDELGIFPLAINVRI